MVAECGGLLWCAPSNASSVLAIDPKTETVRTIECGVEDSHNRFWVTNAPIPIPKNSFGQDWSIYPGMAVPLQMSTSLDTLLVSDWELHVLKNFMKNIEPNPRSLKRILNIYQTITQVARNKCQ